MYFRAVSVIVIAALWGMQLGLRFFVPERNRQRWPSWLIKVWILGAGLIVLGLVQETYALYGAWQSGPLTVLLLPPHRSPAYFLGYVGARYLAPWVIAAAAAWAVYRSARFLNRRAGERFFEAEEPLMFAAAVFFVGYPGFIFYVLLLGVAAFLLTLAYSLFKLGRAPLYFLWFPAALFAILIMYEWLPADLLPKFNL